MLSVLEAQKRVLDLVARLESCTVPLRDALHFSLADEIVSPCDVPPFDNSAMDGFAVRSDETAQASADSPKSLRIKGKFMAGDKPGAIVESGSCAAVMTGAPIPLGADSVIMIEDVTVSGEMVLISTPAARGDNVREAGEDIRRGMPVLEAGTELRPQEIGVLASLGIRQVDVVRKPVVGVMATGDELVPLGEPLQLGKIRDSNSHSLRGMVLDTGSSVMDLGIVRDRRGEMLKAFEHALEECDAVLSTGGVSTGELDLVREILSSIGKLEFWRVNMKPGKPLVFATAGGKPVFGLPGNPVSCIVSFELFARPALMKMMGRKNPLKDELVAQAVSPMEKKQGRSEFKRGKMWREGDSLLVDLTGPQGSGILTSLVRANCLVHLPEEKGDVAPGDIVSLIPL